MAEMKIVASKSKEFSIFIGIPILVKSGKSQEKKPREKPRGKTQSGNPLLPAP
jgi:hypothetical protein